MENRSFDPSRVASASVVKVCKMASRSWLMKILFQRVKWSFCLTDEKCGIVRLPR